MKKLSNLLIRSILVFLLSNIIITLWFILAIGSSESHISFNSIKHVFAHYGFALSIPPAISYLFVYLFYKNIQSCWIFYLVTFFITISCLFLMAYIFIWYTSIGIIKDDLFTQ